MGTCQLIIKFTNRLCCTIHTYLPYRLLLLCCSAVHGKEIPWMPNFVQEITYWEGVWLKNWFSLFLCRTRRNCATDLVSESLKKKPQTLWNPKFSLEMIWILLRTFTIYCTSGILKVLAIGLRIKLFYFLAKACLHNSIITCNVPRKYILIPHSFCNKWIHGMMKTDFLRYFPLCIWHRVILPRGKEHESFLATFFIKLTQSANNDDIILGSIDVTSFCFLVL